MSDTGFIDPANAVVTELVQPNVPAQEPVPQPEPQGDTTAPEPEQQPEAGEEGQQPEPKSDEGAKQSDEIKRLLEQHDKRIARATRRNADLSREKETAERRAADLERRLAELERQRGGQQQAPAPGGEGQQPEQSIEERINAEAEKRAAQRIENEKREAAERAFTAACNKTYQAAVKTDPEFVSAVDDLRHVAASVGPDAYRGLLEEVNDLDEAPRVLIALARDPDEAERIAQLPKGRMVRELLKLENGIAEDARKAAEAAETAATARPAPKPAVSNAPRPVTTVQGGAQREAGPTDQDSDAAWYAKWQKENLKKRA